MPLSVEDLYASTDDDVKAVALSMFTTQLKNSSSVKSVFFAGEDTTVAAPSDPGLVDDVACALVCSAISRSSQFGFAQTVDQGRCDGAWRTRLVSDEAVQAGQLLYGSAFADHCRTADHSFAEYLADPGGGWATQLAEHVTTDDFVNVEIAKLIAGQANWLDLLNLVFYKIQRLDPTKVAPVLATWTAAYPDKGITQTWQSANHVPASGFSADQFIGQASQAIGQKKWEGQGGYTTSEEFYVYGDQVDGFLRDRPTQLGLTTGQRPDNQVTENSGGIFGCFVAGTPVHLADGTTIPVERVSLDDEVLAQGGLTGVHSDERVVVPLPEGCTIYGINDLDPFFSAGHLFWTTEGWKAISPRIALEENADREVGQLQVGDVVHRVVRTDPLRYDEVRIDQISQARLDAGATLHGLHLHGARSYHAHGFCVGMNYPVITEKRLMDGFARLTPSERQLVDAHLSAIAPLLEHAVGRFVTAPLRRAVVTAHGAAPAGLS
ncbi:hypothetical protein [Micromonospora sp. 4G55]|uniref:hypothetical protein n=1 Tax=Micromonospora sp. 4G55 TaxID=2806102 RepID=UPI001A3D7A91|nr:hypothetical protein [Micromonospora sp. 4G55]MBM0255471.1 hypothetical protein [Micromonospora sp. 4G55]